MNSRFDIEQDILRQRSTYQDGLRHEYLRRLHDHTWRDTILYASAYSKSPHGTAIDGSDLQRFTSAVQGLEGDSLDLILHSPGGSFETTKQVVDFLRGRYNSIRAIIPQNAMSAATMLACACDEIVMGQEAAIGPIDPQVAVPTSRGYMYTAAQHILDEYEHARSEVLHDQRLGLLWASRIRDYPPGLLQRCGALVELSKESVHDWLQTFMFRGDQNAGSKASTIADWLGDANLHKTHGKPITYRECADMGLRVRLLDDDPTFQSLILSVFHATMVAFDITPLVKIVENHNGEGSHVVVESS